MNEVTVKQTSEVSEAMDLSSWGVSPGTVSSKDIIIPQIHMMQGMAKKVTAGLAAFGEFRESLGNQLLGGFNKPIEIIPFHMEKLWIEKQTIPDGKKTKDVYVRTLPMTTENENLPWDERVNGLGDFRVYTYKFYVLLGNGEVNSGIPHTIFLSKSSRKAGQKIATQMFVLNANAGKIPPATAMELSSNSTTNDDGTYAVADARATRPATAGEMQSAFRWLKLVKGGEVKEDTTIEEEAATDAVPF